MTTLGIVMAAVMVVVGLFVHPVFLMTAMVIIAFDVYLARKG